MLSRIGVVVALILTSFSLGTPAQAAGPAIRCVPSVAVEAGCTDDYATIQAALDASAPGDTVAVGSGTYNESLVLWKNASAEVLDGLTLRAAVGATPALVSASGARCTSTPTTLVPGRSALQIGDADDVTVEGFDITSSNLGGEDESVIAVSGDVDGLIIRGNTLRDENDGIQFRDSCMPGTFTNALIEDNHIVHTGACIKAQDIVGLIIRNNTMDNCTEFGVVLETLSASMEIRDVEVSGNRIYNIRHSSKGYGGILVKRRSSTGIVTDISIHRNEIYALNDGNAITIQRGADDVRVTHNTIYDNGIDNGSSAIVIADDALGANTFTRLFVVNNLILRSGAGIQTKRAVLDATSTFDHNAFWEIDGETYWNDGSDPASHLLVQGAHDVEGFVELNAPGDDLSADLRPRCSSMTVDAGMDYGQTEPKIGPAYDIGAHEGCIWILESHVRCDETTDDIAAIQGAFRGLSPLQPTTVYLYGTCDISAAPAAGGDYASIGHAAILVPSNLQVAIRSGLGGRALVRGGGDEAAFLFPPGSTGAALEGIDVESVDNAVVAWNSRGTTVYDLNVVAGVRSSAPVLGLGNDRSGATPGLVEVTYGADTTRTAQFTTSRTLRDFIVDDNTITMPVPVGSRPGDATPIDIRQRFAGLIQGVAILENTVGSTASTFPSFNQNGIRVMAHAGGNEFFIEGVMIRANHVGVPAPGSVIRGAGRIGIILKGVGQFRITENSVHGIVTGASVPGGGIIVSDSSYGEITRNVVSEETDQTVGDADLGAIVVMDDIMTLHGATNENTLTTEVLVGGNEILPLALPRLGAQRGLVVNDASEVHIVGLETYAGIRDRALVIGSKMSGNGIYSLPATRVTNSTLCGISIDGVLNKPSSVRFVAGIGSVGNAFPHGFLYSQNSGC